MDFSSLELSKINGIFYGNNYTILNDQVLHFWNLDGQNYFTHSELNFLWLLQFHKRTRRIVKKSILCCINGTSILIDHKNSGRHEGIHWTRISSDKIHRSSCEMRQAIILLCSFLSFSLAMGTASCSEHSRPFLFMLMCIHVANEIAWEDVRRCIGTNAISTREQKRSALVVWCFSN